jgi:hypothetical protein
LEYFTGIPYGIEFSHDTYENILQIYIILFINC